MKTFKQFIREQEELEENRLRRFAAAGALGLGLIGGMQAGDTSYEELPTFRKSVATTEKQPSGESRLVVSKDSEFAKKGQQTSFGKKGLFDLKSKIEHGAASGREPESTLHISKVSPQGKEGEVVHHQVGDKSTTHGNYEKTQFKNPQTDEEGNVIRNPTIGYTMHSIQSDNMPTHDNTGPITTGEKVAGGIGAAATLAGIGRFLNRSKRRR